MFQLRILLLFIILTSSGSIILPWDVKTDHKLQSAPPADELVIKLMPGETRKDLEEILNRNPHFMLDKQVDFVEVQTRRKVHTFKINPDPELSELWHLNNDVTYSQDIDKVWAKGFTGNGVRIGVVDTLTQTDHVDLTNMDVANSYDYYNDRPDHIPVTGMFHGTSVSGIIGGTKGNNFCSVGVAYDATLVAIGLLGANEVYLTDAQMASALSHDNIDIYSNSWGSDHYSSFISMGQLTQEAFEFKVANGRKGKGSIYVYAAGNGGPQANANVDELLTSIYTITITSVQDKSSVFYGEVGSNIMAASYGGSQEDRLMTSLDLEDRCLGEFLQGTSCACPIAAGIIALALEVNPNLTWRDVQHLIVRNSGKYTFKDDKYSWQRNGRGFQFHPKLGFGLINAEKVVNMAKIWRTVSQQLIYTSPASLPSVSAANPKSAEGVITISWAATTIRFLEHVLVTASVSTTREEGLTEIDLISPCGTKSLLLSSRRYDSDFGTTFTWTYKSVHFWGENPIGNWKLQVRLIYKKDIVTLQSWSLTLYGIAKNPR